MMHDLAPVESCSEVAPGIFLLRCDSAAIAGGAEPGSFVNVLADQGRGPFLRRPFSISRVEGRNIEIVFNVVGLGTTLLSQKRPGDIVDILGALGSPFRFTEGFQTAILVAGGLGVAPFPFLTDRLRKLEKSRITFLGARTAGQVLENHLDHVEVAT
ncbi:MAG: dihydroorotate dehydrogenase electron transfer subunit, partial [Bacteroidota bacterium]